MATRARVRRSQVKARSPGSDAGECRETGGKLGGRWASLGVVGPSPGATGTSGDTGATGATGATGVGASPTFVLCKIAQLLSQIND